eukprot:g2530.t1
MASQFLGRANLDQKVEEADHYRELNDYDESEEEVEDKNDSFFGAVLNLTNTILGSGVITMPYACRLGGLGLFTTILLFVAALSDYAIKLIFIAVERIKFLQLSQGPTSLALRTETLVQKEKEFIVSYGTLGRLLYGWQMESISNWCVTLQQIGACTGYIVIIGDILNPIAVEILPHDWHEDWKQKALQIPIICFVIFPLCLLRRFDALAGISGLAIFFILSLVVVVAVWGIMRAVGLDEEAAYPRLGKVDFLPSSPQVIEMLPLFAFSFLCHQNTFPVYREMKDPSPEKIAKVSHVSMIICAFVYLLIGMCGYFAFLENTCGDLLKNFYFSGSTIDTAVSILRVGFGVSVIFSYPLVVWEARLNISQLVFSTTKLSNRANFLLNLSIVGGTAIVGLNVTHIDNVLGLVGATCSPMMIFVLPALFYLKSIALPLPPLNTAVDASASISTYSKKDTFMAWFSLIFGCLLIPICAALWALKVFKIYPTENALVECHDHHEL